MQENKVHALYSFSIAKDLFFQVEGMCVCVLDAFKTDRIYLKPG